MVDNRHIRQINKMLKKRILEKFGVLAVALLVVGFVAFLGFSQNKGSHAATSGSMSLTASPPSAVVGSNVAVTIKADSGTTTVNAVQALVTYDAAKLQYVSISEGGVFTNIAATKTSTVGQVFIGRGTQANKSVSGLNTISTLTFKVLGSSGSTALAVDPQYSLLVSSTDNVNILSAFSNTSVSMKLPAPVINSVAPVSGLSDRVTPITITGANFVNGATVTIGGVAATSTSFVNSTTITTSAPVHAPGAADVVVKNPDGQLTTKTEGFTYINAAPTITAITPTSGTTLGNTKITITGSRFSGKPSLKVLFGGVAGTGLTIVSDTQLTVTTPAHAAGAIDVVVNDGSATATLVRAYTYKAPAPTVNAVSPPSGPSAGKTMVTITGTNFVSGAKVSFGSIAATGVAYVNSTTLTAQSPTLTGASVTVAVSVTNPDGQAASKPNAFTYYAAGDANGDGRVNAIDLSILISHDGQQYSAADFNGDGTVGAADLAILLGKWTW